MLIQFSSKCFRSGGISRMFLWSIWLLCGTECVIVSNFSVCLPLWAGKIPPESTLIFNVDLLEIRNGPRSHESFQEMDLNDDWKLSKQEVSGLLFLWGNPLGGNLMGSCRGKGKDKPKLVSLTLSKTKVKMHSCAAPCWASDPSWTTGSRDLKGVH